MTTDPTLIDRTGYKITADDSIVVIEVVGKTKSGNIYLLRNYIKDTPELKSGAYFVTAAQLEAMIIGYSTGLWLDNMTDTSED